MSVSFWQHATSADAAAYDVVVVGGGIIGCSTAFWLRRRRSKLRVAIVEAQSLGSGASGRNAGFLLQGTDRDYLTDVDRYGAQRAKQLWRFTRESRNLIESELKGSAFDFEACGGLVVAGDAGEDERLEASVSPLRAIGAPVVYLSPKETNRRLASEGFRGSLFVTSGAMMNPLHLVQHIAAASRAQVFEYQPVRAITPVGDHYRVETEGRQIETGQVVVATGAHLPKLIPALNRYVRPVRAQMLATEPAASHIRVPAYSHAGEFYIRQAPSGEVLLGGARHRHADEETGYRDATTHAVQYDLEQYLDAHFPWARGLDVTQRWSGTMGFSPDGLPVVGTVPEQPGNVWATGFTGHGMSYGFRMGQLLAALALGDSNPSGYRLFAASRFRDTTSGEPDRGPRPSGRRPSTPETAL
jgi:glycine/D-amino acid oxidase-like deaminating enzyme